MPVRRVLRGIWPNAAEWKNNVSLLALLQEDRRCDHGSLNAPLNLLRCQFVVSGFGLRRSTLLLDDLVFQLIQGIQSRLLTREVEFL